MSLSQSEIRDLDEAEILSYILQSFRDVAQRPHLSVLTNVGPPKLQRAPPTMPKPPLGYNVGSLVPKKPQS